MNIIIILYIIQIIMPSYIDNMKSQFLHNHQRNNRHEKNVILKRFFRCIFPCQSHDCCNKPNCFCIRDYWGPICYCKN